MSSTGIYEIIPGFAAGLAAAVAATFLDKEPNKEVEEIFILAGEDAKNSESSPA